MNERAHTKKVALLLLPVLLTFSFQWALEVFHPIAEQVPASNDHQHEGMVIHDTGNSDFGEHESHFCPHSSAFAQMSLVAAVFSGRDGTTITASIIHSPVLGQESNVRERGPPTL
jgi:hypothetical protein